MQRKLQSLFSSLPRSFNFPWCKAHSHHTDMHFNQRHNTHQHCPLWLHSSHQLKLLGSRRTHRTVSCWAALIEKAYVLSQARWVGRERKGKETDKTLHQSVVAEQISRVAESFTVSHMHVVHVTCTVLHALQVMNIPRWNDSSWLFQRSAFSLLWSFPYSFGLVKDRLRTKLVLQT